MTNTTRTRHWLQRLTIILASVAAMILTLGMTTIISKAATDPHSNESVSNPVNWTKWQNNPILKFDADPITGYIDENNYAGNFTRYNHDYQWIKSGDVVATLTRDDKIDFGVEAGHMKPTSFKLTVFNNGKEVPEDQYQVTDLGTNSNGWYRYSFSIPVPADVPKTIDSNHMVDCKFNPNFWTNLSA